MALSNAERQRRYRQRRKAGSNLLEKLNEAFLRGEMDGENTALNDIRAEPTTDSEWNDLARYMAENPSDIGRTIDEWLAHAYEDGRKIGQETVMDVRHEHLARKNAANEKAEQPEQPTARKRAA